MYVKPSKEELQNLLLSYNTSKELSSFLNISLSTLNKWIKFYDLHKGWLKKRPSKEVLEELTRTMSDREIALIYKVSKQRVSQWMKAEKVTRFDENNIISKLELVLLYEKYKSLNQISRILKVTRYRVEKLFNIHKIEVNYSSLFKRESQAYKPFFDLNNNIVKIHKNEVLGYMKQGYQYANKTAHIYHYGLKKSRQIVFYKNPKKANLRLLKCLEQGYVFCRKILQEI